MLEEVILIKACFGSTKSRYTEGDVEISISKMSCRLCSPMQSEAMASVSKKSRGKK